MSAHPIYHLILDADKCLVRVHVNGFPAYELHADTWREVTPPLNPLLIGEGNEVVVEVGPVLLEGDRPSTFREMEVQGRIERYDKGSIVEPKQGVLALTFAKPELLIEMDRRGEDVPLPFVVTGRFDSEGPGFAHRLLDGSPCGDEEALRDYAMHLRALAMARDADGLVREFLPKVQDYARAYGEEESSLYAEFRGTVADEILSQELVDFSREDLELVPCCGGRLVQLRRRDSSRLIETAPREEGASVMFLKVFAGMVDGDLRVLR